MHYLFYQEDKDQIRALQFIVTTHVHQMMVHQSIKSTKTKYRKLSVISSVRRPISANPELNFNPGLFFFSSKAFSRTIFSILFRVANHQIVDKKN